MTMGLHHEVYRKLGALIVNRLTSPLTAAGAALVVATDTAKLDSAAMEFMINGVQRTALTLNEAAYPSHDPTNDPYVIVPDGKKCLIGLYLNAASTATSIIGRQGPIVDTGATAELPATPDGAAFIGYLEVDDVTGGWTPNSSAVNAAGVTIIEGSLPHSGPSAVPAASVGTI